ncbi:MAG: hypothetical protein HQL16_07900, partial [Candidatus Omnitrophica bacterium]|nr:hypothetical protein [Candidatus Omnitrophota bacterium]
MLKFFCRQSGQVITGEYVVMIIIAVVAITTMSLYIRRAFQGRLLDADRRIFAVATKAMNADVPMQYEPYYVVSISNTDTMTDDRTHILPDGNFSKIIDYTRTTRSNSQQ